MRPEECFCAEFGRTVVWNGSLTAYDGQGIVRVTCPLSHEGWGGIGWFIYWREAADPCRRAKCHQIASA